uniref:Uncharacterized protein n=1 Tax=Arundo donax TaxID=35708 RepID=A0A0A9H2C7_ARUDO
MAARRQEGYIQSQATRLMAPSYYQHWSVSHVRRGRPEPPAPHRGQGRCATTTAIAAMTAARS